MSRPDIEAIRERVNEATPGPWGVNLGPYTVTVAQIGGHWVDCEGRRKSPNEIDAEFIAHARTDVPDLLAHIDALEESLRAAVGRCGCLFHVATGDALHQCDSCRTDLALLDGSESPGWGMPCSRCLDSPCTCQGSSFSMGVSE